MKKDKIDPLDAKKAERFATAKQITFEGAARDYFKGHEQKWSNKIHSEQFLSSLQTYAFDQIGKLPVAKIDTTVVLEVLKPIWYAKTVTAVKMHFRQADREQKLSKSEGNLQVRMEFLPESE